MSMNQVIQRRRRELGMTQEQVAQALNVTAPAVNKWEKGATCPDVSLLAALAERFGVSVERLLSGDLEPNELDGGNMKRLKFYVCPDCGGVPSPDRSIPGAGAAPAPGL